MSGFIGGLRVAGFSEACYKALGFRGSGFMSRGLGLRVKGFGRFGVDEFRVCIPDPAMKRQQGACFHILP